MADGHDQQVPAIVEQLAGVPSDVPVAAILGREKITRPGIMAASEESVADDAGELASDQNLQDAAPQVYLIPSHSNSLQENKRETNGRERRPRFVGFGLRSFYN